MEEKWDSSSQDGQANIIDLHFRQSGDITNDKHQVYEEYYQPGH